MIDLKQMTMDVCHVARQCGEFLKEERKSFRRDKVEEKNAHDYVSYVDKETEKQVVALLKALLPEAGFIAEEGTADFHDEAYCWVIDPLDGTTNYIHDNAPYCVSIALRSGKELLIGVVYEVCRNECFYAWKGGGAWMNEQPISVSDVNDVEKAFVVCELPYNSDAYKHTALHLIHSLYGRVGGIRMNGSAAAAICYVAAGRFDAWAESFIGRWDFSAAALLVMEAGGQVTDFYGSNDFVEGHHIIASNGRLHHLFADLLPQAYPHGM